MATSNEIFENEVEIYHLHPNHFHMEKRLYKSVQYILRYFTKYASFLPCRKQSTEMTPFSLKLLDHSSRNFYTYRGIICAVNAHIEAAISHSVSE